MTDRRPTSDPRGAGPGGAAGDASDGLPADDGSDTDGASDRSDDLPAPMRRLSDRGYVPDSDQYDFAVRTPDGGREYRETVEGAFARLRKHYADEVVGSVGEE